jgi:hypothetical protein
MINKVYKRSLVNKFAKKDCADLLRKILIDSKNLKARLQEQDKDCEPLDITLPVINKKARKIIKTKKER